MSRLFLRHVAVPPEHGAWALVALPLIIGLAAGRRASVLSVYVVTATLGAFLARHPLTLAIKAYSGRRGRDVLPAAWFWTIVYGVVGALPVLGLVLRGYGYVLWLAAPGVPVLAWHLWLVGRREERRQRLVEVLAAGALALAAPAAYWVAVKAADPTGWLLWGLTWAHSAASIVHAYMRLEQRALGRAPDPREGWRTARPAVILTSFNLAVVSGLCVESVVAPLLFVPYAVQWLETLRGAARPAVGLKPRAIGFRQLAVTIVFTLLFVGLW